MSLPKPAAVVIFAIASLIASPFSAAATRQVPLDISGGFNMDAIVGPAEYRVCLIDAANSLIDLFGTRADGNGEYVRSQSDFLVAGGYGGDRNYSVTATSSHPYYLSGTDALPADGVIHGGDRLYHMASLNGNATLPGDWTQTLDPSDYSLQPNCIHVGAYHNRADWQTAAITVELPYAQKGAYQDVNFVLAAYNGGHLARNMQIVALYGPNAEDEQILYTFSTSAGGSGPVMTAAAPAGFSETCAITKIYSNSTGQTGGVRSSGSRLFEFDAPLPLDDTKQLWGFRFEDVNPSLNWAARGLSVFAATANTYVEGNIAPVADAGGNQVVIDSDNSGTEDVWLNADASVDADSEILSYIWSEDGAEIGCGVNAIAALPLGSHTVTLTVSDGTASDSDTIVIDVNTPPPGAPIADAGADRIISDADNSGDETLMLNGTTSSDLDGQIVSWTWSLSGVNIASGEQAEVTLPVGSHTIVLSVTDNEGLSRTDTVQITITPYSPAATYHVDAATGDDANDGSTAFPWATIQHAADSISGGDTVIVRPGAYDERITVKKSGAEGNLVTFRAEPSRQAIVKGFTLQGDYISIEGFEITNTAAGANGIHAGEAHRGTARLGCRMIDNYIHDIDGRCIFSGTSAFVSGNLMRNIGNGLFVNSDSLVENNEIDTLTLVMEADDDARDAKYAFWAGDDIIFRGNYFYGTSMEYITSMSVDFFATWDSWIYGPSHRILIENNIGFNATHASEPTAEAHTESSHITYRNNVFCNTAFVGILCKGWSNITIVNNTLINCGAFAIWFQTARETEGAVVRNNLISYWNHTPPPGGHEAFRGIANGMEWQDPSYTIECDYNMLWATDNRFYGPNDFTDEPVFVDPDNGDFRLAAGSPGIDAASLIAAPQFDLIGVQRPVGAAVDIGAYEYTPAKAGDANADGYVDLDDFIILKQHYGISSGATLADGDFNGDGKVNLDDFIILKQNYGS